MPIIPAVGEVEMGGSWFEASLGKKLARSHLNKEAGSVNLASL
jgi:hypothetical protein